ncbi:MAG: nucleoside hydrolase [Anaerolineales bacterium]|nr:nucleoside hydrolase [Anaerolineales bacterium]
MVKILLDTDIGTDVDDAVCLAYLLAQPACELLGITTVTGEAVKRASLASALCIAAGRDIPIYPGAERPLFGEQRQKIAQQAAALPRWAHQGDFPQGQAISFMADTIRAHPGEIILLTIGPLTNAGLLFSAYPDIPALLKGMFLMGGDFGEGTQRVEWNIAGDPHASEIVFQASLPDIHVVGLNVTQRVMLTAEQVRQSFTAPLLRPVVDFAEIWFAQFFPSITFHDPLTAAAIFDDTLCSFIPCTVTIDTVEIPGRTIWQPGGDEQTHQVAIDVDAERYFDHFFSVF